ncbi:MAG: hypothetical protein K1X78_08655 [Verrucomicrobiaceae bacterium]|nr:hypothetical protein [Verrucomicrobiaceae bacterium]
MRTFLHLLGLLLVCGAAHAIDDDPDAAQGDWEKPPANGKPWKHSGTGLAFPQFLGSFRMAGEFRFKEGGGRFIRYESTEERARADIFFFPHTTSELSLENTKAAINNELEAVIAQFQERANKGRYKNVIIDGPADGEIPLWPTGSLPLSVRSLVATKLADTKEGPKEAQIKQWTGVTMLKGHLITIRYMHPTATGEQGEAALKGFAGMVFQVIKDPQLRAQVRELVQVYLADPLSAEGNQAATAVLAYIQKTPFVNVPIPVEALAPWLDVFKSNAPGSELQLLRAFALGSARAGLDEADAAACLTAGAKQFLLIYDRFIRENPLLKVPGVDELKSAVEHNDVAAFLKRRAVERK